MVVNEPLVVDLDGTLIRTDMLHESALMAIRDRPWNTFQLPFWLLKGKAAFKKQLAERVRVDPQGLPYNLELIRWLREEKLQGRRLVLCTASDEIVANAIAAHLDLFHEVIASDGSSNLSGETKAEVLVKRFGSSGYDYVGNSHADLPVWKHAKRAIVVNASADLVELAGAQGNVVSILPEHTHWLKVLHRVFRVHQWLKNVLLLIPLIAAHQFSAKAVNVLIPAFFAFSLVASAVYVANDLLDLESDRLHPRKRLRPFASGDVPAWVGVAFAPILLSGGWLLASVVGERFLGWLVIYFVLTCAYSFRLKRAVLIDCIVLAILYTIRVAAGAAALDMNVSFWLFAFSVFLFLSLAFVKRYAEFGVQAEEGRAKTHGRGYYTNDAPVVQALGIASGYAAVTVLALYLNSDAVIVLYKQPEFVWGGVLVLMFWISWMWLQAHRRNMHDDPLVFAFKDRVSQLSAGAFAGALILGAVGWP